MADTATTYVNGFLNFIMGLIKYIKALVAYFRDENDGEEGTMPEFPTFMSTETTTEE